LAKSILRPKFWLSERLSAVTVGTGQVCT